MKGMYKPEACFYYDIARRYAERGRSDLMDSLSILEEGYENTFAEKP